MTIEELKYFEITEKIIGSAMAVHNNFGNGFQELIYQRALAIEMTKRNLDFIRELVMPIYYSNEQIGTRRVAFFVEDKIMVEIKAISLLDKIHLAQALNYLDAYKMEVGLLINFGNTKLEFKRLTNSNKLQNQK